MHRSLLVVHRWYVTMDERTTNSLGRFIFAAAVVPFAAIPLVIWRDELSALNGLFFASPLVAGFIVGRDRTDGVCRRGALAGALGTAFTIASASLASHGELKGAAVVPSAGSRRWYRRCCAPDAQKPTITSSSGVTLFYSYNFIIVM